MSRDYICDDRLDVEKLGDDFENMSEEEFENFQKEVEKTGKYPDKYYLTK